MDKFMNETVHYPVISSDSIPIRTDASSRTRENPKHHHEVSPLVKLDDTDMINDFLTDFMHQGYLGNVKKIPMDHWFKLEKIFLTREQMLTVSQRLIDIANQFHLTFKEQQDPQQSAAYGQQLNRDFSFYMQLH
ncbi:hypothetical protein QAD02_001978 [Eretmocerus hayati]|uniref:Uncharacterized protein n=1 Tax=Eretmocerus hayati TaxID=131215 RepID=A0ACC2NHK3_9HYME|nr:hypothetical protein QAD02_001978 [Eretmocerus hayati]